MDEDRTPSPIAAEPESSSYWVLWKKLGWRKWLLIFLFPNPMGSWWVTLIWAALFCVMVWLMFRDVKKKSAQPAPPEIQKE
jgi:hypothetical protein